MMVLGLVHAALLYYGDILAAYGLLAVMLVSALRHSEQPAVDHGRSVVSGRCGRLRLLRGTR